MTNSSNIYVDAIESLRNSNVTFFNAFKFKDSKLPGSFVYFDGNEMKQVYIKEIYYNNPATIVFWSDNTKTISKINECDEYSEEVGLVLCILKKLCGSTNVKKTLDSWLPKQEQVRGTCKKVTLNDVRRIYENK